MLPRTHVQAIISELVCLLSLSGGTWDTKPPRTLVSTTNSSLFFMGRLFCPNYIFVYLKCYPQYCFITIFMLVTVICVVFVFSRFNISWGTSKKTLEITEGAFQNGQPRDTGNIGHTRHRTKANKHNNTTSKNKKMSNVDPTKHRVMPHLNIEVLWIYIYLRTII
jgi:hypothetical protein